MLLVFFPVTSGLKPNHIGLHSTHEGSPTVVYELLKGGTTACPVAIVFRSPSTLPLGQVMPLPTLPFFAMRLFAVRGAPSVPATGTPVAIGGLFSAT